MERLLLEGRGIHAGYGALPALFGVNFGLPAGSVVALLGPNGAGKSTLLRVLAGSLRPWEGSIRMGDAPIAGLAPWDVVRLGICYIPEGGGVFHELSVRDNLALSSRTMGLDRDARAAFDEVFELFPVLRSRQAQHAGSLSGGEKRMLALSRALLTRPRVLLVDEPSLGLAPIVTDEIFQVLERLNRELGMAIVIVEQYVERALAIADYAWVLAKGAVVYSGEAGALKSSGVLSHAYLGEEHPPPAMTTKAKVTGVPGKRTRARRSRG